MRACAIIAHFAALKGLSLRTARERALSLLDTYGLRDFAHRRAEQLSKGMGQKVQVLAAIAHDPELVVLDEPFSGLDPVNQTVLEDIIHDLRRRGRTVIFSTHVMQHAERLCDHLVIIGRGRKLFDGTVAAARQRLPMRLQLDTSDDIAPLRQLPSVVSVQRTPDGQWELELRENSDAQPILEACATHHLRLRRFNTLEPTLHDVFVKLVGPGAAEALDR
jgi:ABC-2 type transport system ATP-binding protein